MLTYIKRIDAEMSEYTTPTSFEIKKPTDKLTADGFRTLVAEQYGLNGLSAELRVHQLKQLPADTIHSFIVELNKSLQGSKDSLETHDTAMNIGTATAVHPEHRTAVLESIVESIKASPDTVHPYRIADVLAMSVVMLHPFDDGNGRTARAIGLAFREEYDSIFFEDDFNTLTRPRDEARARGEALNSSYMPRLPAGFDRSDPAQVSDYLASLLTDESDMPDYIGPFPPSALHK
ncbi:MAG: Fic family protein [Patescibacteria group bacterium]